jgi:hypothetical protein
MLQELRKLPCKLFVSHFNRLRKNLGKGYNRRIGAQLPRMEGAYDFFCNRSELRVGFYVVNNGSGINEDAVDLGKLFRKSHSLSSLRRFTTS